MAINDAAQRRRRSWILVGAGFVGVAALITTIVLVAVFCGSEDPISERYKLTTFDAMGNKKVMDMTPDQFFQAMKENTAFMLGDDRVQSEALYGCILDMTKSLGDWKVAADEAAAKAKAEEAAAGEEQPAEVAPAEAPKETTGCCSTPEKVADTPQAPATMVEASSTGAPEKPVEMTESPAATPTSTAEPGIPTAPGDASGLRGTSTGAPVSLRRRIAYRIAERLAQRRDNREAVVTSGLGDYMWNSIAAIVEAIDSAVPLHLWRDTYEGDLDIDETM
ncbi:membrane protein, putative [Babesia bigemina]|uniref:Membrane protein, putative n=1 Tax=Babesia bigemina TaxID=5866 RepID=A0A061D781_BABBI|nr:membrane protein, putative [Babesia bigemina]CDR96393.1 membrane protein, putative [Babesia bigemina]|eukprot:XP_012768579.1 membrane protein, putative [Babesia bigemina]